TRGSGDGSSDVCSSDLDAHAGTLRSLAQALDDVVERLGERAERAGVRVQVDVERGLGYVMAGLRHDKRALHDLIAGTRVERVSGPRVVDGATEPSVEAPASQPSGSGTS